MSGNNLNPIILLGGGGHARSTLDIILESGECDVAGILDDTLEPGLNVLGAEVLGPTALISKFAKSHEFVVALGKIGRSTKRRELAERCWEEGATLRTVISPRAYVSPHATIEEGSAVFHGAIVNAGARIGRNCIINSMALVEHDTVVGDHSHVSTGAIVNGACRIGAGVFLGSGTTVHHKVTIDDGEVVSAGQVIRNQAKP